MSTSTERSTAQSRRRLRRPSSSSSSSSSSVPPPAQYRRLLPPPLVHEGISFMNEDARGKWPLLRRRHLAIEPALSETTVADNEVMGILRPSGLLPLLAPLGPCFGKAVREFVCHIPARISDPLSGQLFVVPFRAREINFSPGILNEILGTPDEGMTTFDFALADVADELTGGEFAEWPQDTGLPFLALSFKYAVLHRAVRARVLPTEDVLTLPPRVGRILFALGTGITINFGQLLFQTICDIAQSPDALLPVVFPCLLSRVLSLDPTVLTASDAITPPPADLCIPRLPLTVRTCLKAELVALRAQVASLQQREVLLRHQLQSQPLRPWP